MTPEETKAMAERIEKNRQEENKAKVATAKKAPAQAAKTKVKATAKKVAKPVKAAKPAKAKAKTERTKVIGPATKKFKFKPNKSIEVCDVLNCREKPKSGWRCDKHRKLIRTAQLAANNVVWKKRVAEGTAGHHVVYTRPGEKKPIATKFSLSKTDHALKAVTGGHSIIEKVGDFKEIVSRTKRQMKEA